MIPRILETEVMDTVAEAVDYNSMDHTEVNRVFVDDFLRARNRYDASASRSHKAPGGLGGAEGADHPGADASAAAMRVLDVGTGTALIPIELCRCSVLCYVTAVDLAGEMFKLADQNVADAGLLEQITLELVDAKSLPYEDGQFDAVISNSIVHHIPKPATVLAEMVRVLRAEGLLFVRDLLRPDDIETLNQLVTTYTGDVNAHQRQMFRDSLCAALTISEVRNVLNDLGLPEDWGEQTTDRHWTIIGRRSSA